MARPALSASRAVDVLDLFAAFPGRAFTTSEIVHTAEINIASCHALTHQRGFQGTLRTRRSEGFAELMKSMAARTQPLEYHIQASHLIADHGWTFEQPETLQTKGVYDVGLIAAPIFDQDGHAMLSLGFGGLPDAMHGARIAMLGERLMATCLAIMREGRGA